MLPWTAIPVAAALAGRGQTGGKPQSGRRGWSARSFLWAAMGGGFLTLCAVGEKHEYYLLPLLAPASALAAFWLETANPRVSERFWAAAGAIFLLIGAACAALPLANPYPVELEGAEWAGAALALGGAAAIGWRGRGAWAPQAALLAAATVWIGIATAWTMPSLDPVFSPRAMALALERIAREEGLEPIAFHLDEGALSYYLRRPCPSHEDWEAFLAAAERLGAAAAIVPLDRRGEMESLGWRIEPAGEFCQAGAYYLAARIEKRPDAE
ncbi:MAG: hypothetical protein BWZ10_01818 [candidate division BRC1 bacterium ADurb.BinA364]|nr:MAG: hypothetical protein BWZ10_01818 [candidate division BRC1 bacterium ADurb.BinA364]